MCKMSGIELVYHILMLFVLVVQILLAIYVSYNQFNFFQTAAAEFFVVGVLSLLISFAYYNDGAMTIGELKENLCGVLHDVLECFISAYGAASLGEQIAFAILTYLGVVLFILQLCLDAASGGAATFLRIAVTTSLVAIYIANFMVDLLDNDYVVG